MKNKAARVNGQACFIGDGYLGRCLAEALGAMRHRARDGYLIGREERRRLSDPKQIIGNDLARGVAVGYCLVGESGEEEPIPLHGSIYRSEDPNLLEKLGRREDDPEALAEALRGVDGDYSFVLPSEGELVFARDPLGVKPLFVGRRGGILGVASEAKALRAAGLNAISVQPGTVYRESLGNLDRFPIRSVGDPGLQETDLGEAAETLLGLVKRSVEKRVKGGGVAVGFSGGVDSSLLALLASRLGEVRLVSVYAAGSRDEAGVKSAARLLGLDLLEVCLTPEEVAKRVGEVSTLIERRSAMDIAIGMAVNAAAEAARDEGCDRLILGQLADELFGGYRRYLQAYSEDGCSAAQAMMREDVRDAYSANIERDEAAASPYADLRLPYAAWELVEYALSLHPRLKIDTATRGRKIVLREAALKVGVPAELALKPKRALQFSSNLQKTVAKALSKDETV